MKPIAISLFVSCVALLSPAAWAVTATYSDSNQAVTLTGLGATNGVPESSVQWGACAYDGTNTNCTVTAPYTGVGGGGTINIVFSYKGNGPSPFTANSTNPNNINLVSFGIKPGNSGSIVVSLVENTGSTVTFLSNNFVFFFDLSATCTGAVSSCSVGQVGLTPNATISGPVYGTFDATPVINAAVTASSYGEFTTMAPGTWMEIYGSNLANIESRTWGSADFNGNAGPTSLAATTVTVGGQPAFVDFVSPGQVNVQVPSNISPGSLPVVVSTPGGTSAAYTATFNATEPGLLAPAVFNLSAGQYVGALFPDNVTFALPPGAVSGVPSARAKPGDTLIIYGIGFGPVTPDSPAGILETVANQINGSLQVFFAGTQAKVDYDGLAVGFMGLYQINVEVPNVPASDTTPLTFSLNGTPGPQSLIIAITN
jgi:uncharacterized protein (TIGR03437 family)